MGSTPTPATTPSHLIILDFRRPLSTPLRYSHIQNDSECFLYLQHRFRSHLPVNLPEARLVHRSELVAHYKTIFWKPCFALLDMHIRRPGFRVFRATVIGATIVTCEYLFMRSPWTTRQGRVFMYSRPTLGSKLTSTTVPWLHLVGIKDRNVRPHPHS